MRATRSIESPVTATAIVNVYPLFAHCDDASHLGAPPPLWTLILFSFFLMMHSAIARRSDCRRDGQQAGVVVEGGLPGGRFGCRERVQRGFRPRPSPNTSVNLQHTREPSCRGALLATLPRHTKVDSRLQLQAQKPMRGARAVQARCRVPAGETLPPVNHKKLALPANRAGQDEKNRSERRTSSSPSKATCPAVSGADSRARHGAVLTSSPLSVSLSLSLSRRSRGSNRSARR